MITAYQLYCAQKKVQEIRWLCAQKPHDQLATKWFERNLKTVSCDLVQIFSINNGSKSSSPDSSKFEQGQLALSIV